MKGVFIPGVTTEMIKNASLESIEELIAGGTFFDVEQESCEGAPVLSRVVAEIRIDGEALQRCVDEAVENVKRELFGNSEQLDKEAHD